MAMTADGAAGNGRLRASTGSQPAVLTPLLVVPLKGPGARSGARVPAGTRPGTRQAITSGVPVATVGGHDTVFVLSEGFLARWSGGLGRRLRGVNLPITLGVPLGVSLEILPTQFPLQAKIRTELRDPIDVEREPERAGDVVYVDRIYREVQAAIQAGMNRLAARRRFPAFG